MSVQLSNSQLEEKDRAHSLPHGELMVMSAEQLSQLNDSIIYPATSAPELTASQLLQSILKHRGKILPLEHIVFVRELLLKNTKFIACDFSSLYPSAMLAMEVDYETSMGIGQFDDAYLRKATK